MQAIGRARSYQSLIRARVARRIAVSKPNHHDELYLRDGESGLVTFQWNTGLERMKSTKDMFINHQSSVIKKITRSPRFFYFATWVS